MVTLDVAKLGVLVMRRLRNRLRNELVCFILVLVLNLILQLRLRMLGLLRVMLSFARIDGDCMSGRWLLEFRRSRRRLRRR